VKSYKNKIEKEFPDALISVLPGDFLSPSALGTAAYTAETADGAGRKTRLYGKQMVDVLNEIGLDVATFGNHEFDVPYLDFSDRIHEAKFPFVTTNVFSAVEGSVGERFHNTVSSMFLTRKGVTFAFVGVVIDANKGTSETFAQIPTFAESVPLVIAEIENWKKSGKKWDVLVAVTHLNLEDDIRLAELVPQIDLILGGHEHENWYINRGDYLHPLVISKADSNVKTVFTHRMKFYPKKIVKGDGFGSARQNPGALKLESELYTIDDTLTGDTTVATTVEKWWQLAKKAFEDTGINIDSAMAYLPHDLDVTEKVVRHQSPSEFGAFMAESFFDHAMLAEMAVQAKPIFSIFNTGSIRMDDKLHEGLMSEYDVLRLLPFGGELRLASTTGARLAQAFALGLSKPGKGSWMAYSSKHLQCGSVASEPGYKECKYKAEDGTWTAFENDKEYVFVTVEYIASGGDNYFPIDPDTNNRDYLKILETKFPMNLQLSMRDSFQKSYPIPADYQRLKRQTGGVIFKGF